MTDIFAEGDHAFVTLEDRIKAVIEQIKGLDHRRIGRENWLDFFCL